VKVVDLNEVCLMARVSYFLFCEMIS